jgi:hypothetical protein
MSEGQESSTTKLCGACSEQLPVDSFSKKQWQNKSRRRCKECTEANREIVVRAEATPAAANNTSGGNKKKKNTPVKAASQHQIHGKDEDDNGIFGIPGMRFADDQMCGWCGKSEGELLKCGSCKNTKFCSMKCQKTAWPEHKLICDQLKQERKGAKRTRRAARKAGKQGASFRTEASGTGHFCMNSDPDAVSMCIYKGELRGDEQPGNHFASDQARESIRSLLGEQTFAAFWQHIQQGPKGDIQEESFSRTEFFQSVNDLTEIDQFLLSCGPLDDIDRAKFALPYLLRRLSISGRTPDGRIPDVGDITVRGYGLNALEWASRRGNYEIAEWLATDPRTSVMLQRSAPVAWACYTNKVELAKMLVDHGANSKATSEEVFNHKPPTHLAAENGQLLAVKYLVEECGHDIHERDRLGQNIRTVIRRNNLTCWRELPGSIAVDDYAARKGVQEYT